MEDRNLNKYSKEDGYKSLDRINSWISNCDSKASILLALIGIMLTVFLTSSSLGVLINDIFRIITKRDCNYFKLFFAILIVINLTAIGYFLFIGLLKLVDVLNPRVEPEIKENEHLPRRSFFYFGDIVSNDFKEYHSQIKAFDDGMILKDINAQIYINSKICDQKFRSFRVAICHMVRAIKLLLPLVILFIVFYLV